MRESGRRGPATLLRHVCLSQGGRQSGHDASGGSQTSVGSQLRRHHEAKWRKTIQDTLCEWAAQIQSCSAIFLHAPGPLNTRVLYFDRSPLQKGDPRIQSVPFTTSRPSFQELNRVYATLNAVAVERR